MTHNSISPQAHRCETHSHFKRYTRFFSYYAHRSTALHQFCELSEQCDRGWTLAGQMLPQRVARAEMRLVAVCKKPSTLPAFPHWREAHIVPASLTQKFGWSSDPLKPETRSHSPTAPPDLPALKLHDAHTMKM